MSRKRSMLPAIYKTKKRICTAPITIPVNGTKTADNVTTDYLFDNDDCNSTPSDVKATLLYMRGLFPVDKFEEILPPVVWQHQIYSIVKNRTVVDKQIDDLRTAGEVKVFKLGTVCDEFAIVFTDDYIKHVRQVAEDSNLDLKIIEKFLASVVKKYSDVSLDKEILTEKFHFTDSEITMLINASVLTVREIGTWWLAIPNAGIFMKYFTRGRKSLLTMIRKSKYREVLKSELEDKKWPKVAKLGIMYHICDITGADLVEWVIRHHIAEKAYMDILQGNAGSGIFFILCVCIKTTSGELLRLKE